jgi:DNA-directed RNA polymerase specialized sigma24 family protein
VREPTPGGKEPRIELLRRAVLAWLSTRMAKVDAEDIASETIVRILEGRRFVSTTDAETRLVFAIARNVLADLWRSRQIHPQQILLSSDSLSLVGRSCHPEHAMQLGDLRSRRRAASCIRALRPLLSRAERRIVRCLRKGIVDNSQIANALGMRVRSIQRLRQQLRGKAPVVLGRSSEIPSHGPMYK